MKRSLAALLIALAAAALHAADPPQASLGTGGGVAAEEGTAAGVGVEILRQGGNAADAAVAVAFALAVTWPEAGNIGGGGFWISRDAKGRVLAVDFRETAPARRPPRSLLRIGNDAATLVHGRTARFRSAGIGRGPRARRTAAPAASPGRRSSSPRSASPATAFR